MEDSPNFLSKGLEVTINVKENAFRGENGRGINFLAKEG